MSQAEAIATAAQEARLSEIVTDALQAARAQGASAAEAGVSASQGLSVTVRLGDVETVEHNRDKTLAITVYFGSRTGSASTSDFSAAAIVDTARAACTIAKYTAEDDCAGLAPRELMAREIPELALCRPWSLDMEQAITLARECEDHARQADDRITNSEGATVSTSEGLEVYGNSHDFLGAIATTRHYLGCSVIAQDDAGMQRDHWYSVVRDAGDLESAQAVGQKAAARALRRLGARQITTREAPVLYEAPMAASLLGHFVSAASGANLYRKSSFLLDQIGEPVFSSGVNIYERPHLRGALGSTPFDNEGVATHDRDLVVDGVLQGYVLDSYSGRKLKMQTTGNAGGVHNLMITPGEQDLPDLLDAMGEGLLVTELIGFGVNGLTGDYSRGAVGFWVENGEIQYPVDEITVAGNLKDMYRGLRAVGADVDTRGNFRTGSILLDRMTIAGK